MSRFNEAVHNQWVPCLPLWASMLAEGMASLTEEVREWMTDGDQRWITFLLIPFVGSCANMRLTDL